MPSCVSVIDSVIGKTEALCDVIRLKVKAALAKNHSYRFMECDGLMGCLPGRLLNEFLLSVIAKLTEAPLFELRL